MFNLTIFNSIMSHTSCMLLHAGIIRLREYIEAAVATE